MVYSILLLQLEFFFKPFNKYLKGVLGWRENGRGKKMGEENGVRGSIFPCLDGEKMGEERKGERKSWWATCPIFLPKFSSQNGGIIGERKTTHHCPMTMLHLTHPFSFLSIFPHPSKHDEG